MAGYVLSAAAVAKLRRALAPKAGSSSRPGAGASHVASDNFSAPFAVRWSASEASGAWVMWLPDKTQCVSVAGEYITPTGITAADDLPAGWYTIDNADEQSTALYLVLTTDNSTGETTAEIDTEAGTASTGETVTNILIASLESDSEAGAKRVRQFVVGTIVLPPGGAAPDNISIELTPPPEEGEEPTGQEGKLQIFDFDTDESDSPEGLVERLEADTKTGKVKLKSGSNIMLIARRDGKVVYIPLTAEGSDPDDEEPYDPENDPCAHPGDNAPGGATSESIDGGGGGVDGGAGGVPAGGGEPHTGDDDCNCERI